MVPPVGKSGPGINLIISSNVVLGLLIRYMSALITSLRLWGGIFVAIPTAMPELPFINKFGILEGNESGSISVWS